MQLESSLQTANYERYRLKDLVEHQDNYGDIKTLVDKIHNMVMLRSDQQFSEEERTILHSLFGDQKHKILPTTLRTRQDDQYFMTFCGGGKDQDIL